MTTQSKSDLYRQLPSVDEILRTGDAMELAGREGQTAVSDAVRTVLNRTRQQIENGEVDPESLVLSRLLVDLRDELQRSSRYSLRSVINATGVILHTNLGRAPLAQDALEHMRDTAGGYSNLEFDLDAGERSKRDVHLDLLFHKILQSASASTIVVNNNAAAVLLALNTLAEGGEVIVSRGELVEIGGSFRIPEIMAKSNAILREVGTTNRTSIADYESAINENTKLLLRVHRSNFEMIGFTSQPRVEELAALARKKKLPMMEDLGSGCLFNLQSIGVRNEPGVRDSLRGGANVVTYSGDKLLGGPQAGIISGAGELVSRMRGNPLFRALRVDKLTYAALESTLRHYVRQDYNSIPALRMIGLSTESIAERAAVMAKKIRSGIKVEIVAGSSVIGGGAAPSAALPTSLIALSSDKVTADEMVRRLRTFDPPIIARVEEGRALIDLRTVLPEQDGIIAEAVTRLFS